MYRRILMALRDSGSIQINRGTSWRKAKTIFTLSVFFISTFSNLLFLFRVEKWPVSQKSQYVRPVDVLDMRLVLQGSGFFDIQF